MRLHSSNSSLAQLLPSRAAHHVDGRRTSAGLWQVRRRLHAKLQLAEYVTTACRLCYCSLQAQQPCNSQACSLQAVLLMQLAGCVHARLQSPDTRHIPHLCVPHVLQASMRPAGAGAVHLRHCAIPAPACSCSPAAAAGVQGGMQRRGCQHPLPGLCRSALSVGYPGGPDSRSLELKQPQPLATQMVIAHTLFTKPFAPT